MGVSEEHAVPEGAPASSGWIARRFTALGAMILTLEGTVQRLFGQLKDSLKAYNEANERGPRDYPLDDDAEDIAHRRRPGDGHVVVIRESPEGGGKGSDSWQGKILIGVAIAVISSAIIGALVTWALVGSLKTHIDDYITSNNQSEQRQNQEIDDLKKHVYRGAE